MPRSSYTSWMDSQGKSAGPIRRFVNDWLDRVLGAAQTGGLSTQEELYESGHTKRDYFWNTLGNACWGMVFPVLTIVATQLVGVERAGMFSLAFILGKIFYIMANYGVRTYQVSDIDEFHSFADYQVNRIITCVATLLVVIIYCFIRGYTGEMFVTVLGLCAYKAVDALAEVYDGRLQQMDKLYLGGISLAARSLAAFAVFTVALFITRNLGIASVAMCVAALAAFFFISMPLAKMETPASTALNLHSVGLLFKECAPVFAALFMYALIDNMPKFIMEGALAYENQLYFNAMYFPPQAIVMVVGLIYKPLLLRLANLWANPSQRKKFDMVIIGMMAVIVAITLVGVGLMAWIGIPLMSFLYGVDFREFSSLVYIMLACGAATASIDFLYQVITVLRRQRVVMGLYLITFAFSFLVLILLIRMTGLRGACIGYLIVMVLLFVLLLREYVNMRRNGTGGGGIARGRFV